MFRVLRRVSRAVHELNSVKLDWMPRLKLSFSLLRCRHCECPKSISRTFPFAPAILVVNLASSQPCETINTFTSRDCLQCPLSLPPTASPRLRSFSLLLIVRFMNQVRTAPFPSRPLSIVHSEPSSSPPQETRDLDMPFTWGLPIDCECFARPPNSSQWSVFPIFVLDHSASALSTPARSFSTFSKLSRDRFEIGMLYKMNDVGV